MKNSFIIRSEDLKEVCNKILTAVDSTELSLVTETLELIAKEDILRLGVTNREYYTEVKFQLEDIQNFHATVNAMLFLKLVSQITTDTIEMYIDGNTLVVIGNGTYKVPLIYDGEELLSLPKITINNVTNTFTIKPEILNSILTYNSKELTKGTISKPVQKFYYVDEYGCITFTNGACVNSFSLEKPIRVLFNNRLVKLFKLFKEGDVKFTIGYDAISDDVVQTKVKFETPSVTVTAILSCDDTLLNSVPVNAIRGRANNTYPYSVNLNKSALIQTINRLTLFNQNSGPYNKIYGTFVFGPNELVVYDANGVNKEVVRYMNDTSNIETPYEMKLNLIELKTTLETCNESYLCMNFGDDSAVVISRGNIKNVIPEIKLTTA